MGALKSIHSVAPVPATGVRDIFTQVSNVMDRYPELSAYGFHFSAPGDWQDIARYKTERERMFGTDFADQVETCLQALLAPRTRRHNLKPERHSSYVLKHLVERWAWESKRDDVTRYISNGAFIVAAVLDGWEPIRLEQSPNCRFRQGGAK